MSGKHTPKPREIREEDFGDEFDFGGDGAGTIEVNGWVNGGCKKDDPEKWAQIQKEARLIAAAPELLEAAELVLAWYEAEDDHSKEPDFYKRVSMCSKSEDAIRAAIAKVKGGAA